MPNVESFVIYGVPWALIVVIVIGLLRKYAKIGSEASALVSAAFAVVGYVLLQALPDIETVLPDLPKYAPIVLWSVVLFGAQLGLVPGDTASKLVNRIFRK